MEHGHDTHTPGFRTPCGDADFGTNGVYVTSFDVNVVEMMRAFFNRPSGFAAVALVAFVAAAPLASGASDDPATALMRRVAAAYSTAVAGVVAVRSHSDLTITAPVFRRHIVDNGWYVFSDGVLTATSHKSDPRQPPLHDPYRERYLGEYTFASSLARHADPARPRSLTKVRRAMSPMRTARS